MAKGKYSRAPVRKSSTPSSTLIFALLLFFTFLVLILLALGIVSIPTSNPSSNHQVHDLNSIVHSTVHRVEVSKERGDQWVEFLSWEPRAFVYHNFLSKDECEYLIKLASPHMEKSQVVDEKTGQSKDSRVRTSSGTFLPRGRDKIVRAIEQRIADFTFLPVEQGEGLQVLHYEVGQKYEPHFDYFLEEYSTANGGQRIATVLMYLSDVEEGGETVFPSAKGNISDVPYWNELSKCGKEGLSVKPKMGDALLFWSMKPDASLDPSSLHGGCPFVMACYWECIHCHVLGWLDILNLAPQLQVHPTNCRSSSSTITYFLYPGDLVNKIPKIMITKTNNIDASGDRSSCSVCLLGLFGCALLYGYELQPAFPPQTFLVVLLNATICFTFLVVISCFGNHFRAGLYSLDME